MATVQREGSKVYIEGVRKLTWDTGEMCEFASALAAAVECLGERAPYAYLMGVSGAAFRFTMDPGAWNPGNYGVRNIAPDPDEPMRRAIEATGYEYAIWPPGDKAADAARIMASIERGAPVLAYPVVGPSDCCVIAGYDEGGEVLLGWSTYQDIPDDHNIPHDATGYFRKPGWHDNLSGYITLGGRGERRPRREIYLDALRWGASLARMPRKGRQATGLAGLRVWAEEMTEDRYFPAGDEGVLGWRYLGAAINMTMLRDHLWAAPFLELAARDEPDLAPGLAGAIESYKESYALREEMDAIMSDNFTPAAMKAIGDPAARRAYAETLLRLGEKEAEAIGQIERAMA